MFECKEVNMAINNDRNEFFATDLLKHTTYSHSDLDALAKNYIEQNKLSIKWKVD